MSANATYLQKHGWTLTSTRRKGMFKIQRWYHPKHGSMNQDMAIINQREDNKFKKATAKMTLPADQKTVRTEYPAAHASHVNPEQEGAQVWELQSGIEGKVLELGNSESEVWARRKNSNPIVVTKGRSTATTTEPVLVVRNERALTYLTVSCRVGVSFTSDVFPPSTEMLEASPTMSTC